MIFKSKTNPPNNYFNGKRIGVLGLAPRCGTTHIAIAISNYLSETEKKSGNTNAKFIQEIRRGDKEIDEIKPIVNYCTMPAELKSDAIDKIRDAMSKNIFLLIIFCYRNNSRK